MAFWLFMLITALLVPVVMLLFGYLFRHHPPSQINTLYGYRTSMSRKNQDTWDFAHTCCGKLWWRIGWVLLPLSVAAMLPFLGKSVDVVGIAGTVITLFQCVVLIAAIFLVERALKETFDEYGDRKA